MDMLHVSYVRINTPISPIHPLVSYDVPSIFPMTSVPSGETGWPKAHWTVFGESMEGYPKMEVSGNGWFVKFIPYGKLT